MKSLIACYENVAAKLQEERGIVVSGYEVAEHFHQRWVDELTLLQQSMLKKFAAHERQFLEERENLRKVAKMNTSTAGGKAEELWIEFFRDFLPSDYDIVQQGHVVASDGSYSRQIDILILKPGYPKSMLNDRAYPLDSVLAGFECKLSLTLADVRDTVAKCGQIKRLYLQEKEPKLGDTTVSFVYGLVSLGHEVGTVQKELCDNIIETIVHSSETLEHPAEMLDLLVIPDALFLSAITDHEDEDHLIWCGYSHTESNYPYSRPQDICLGMFYYKLLNKLPYDDQRLIHQQNLCHFLETHSFCRCDGTMRRRWDGKKYAPISGPSIEPFKKPACPG